jgi:hypothetical protein
MSSSVLNVLLMSVGTCALRISPTAADSGGAVTVGVLVGTAVVVADGAGVGVALGGCAVAVGIGVSVGTTVALVAAVGDDGGGNTTHGAATVAAGVAVGGWRVGGSASRCTCAYS